MLGARQDACRCLKTAQILLKFRLECTNALCVMDAWFNNLAYCFEAFCSGSYCHFSDWYLCQSQMKANPLCKLFKAKVRSDHRSIYVSCEIAFQIRSHPESDTYSPSIAGHVLTILRQRYDLLNGITTLPLRSACGCSPEQTLLFFALSAPALLIHAVSCTSSFILSRECHAQRQGFEQPRINMSMFTLGGTKSGLLCRPWLKWRTWNISSDNTLKRST